ncbi:MAG: hypothetical protein NTV02_02640 [Candidatus Zambryskibacteria bacterium]|nr:hypothetical protein [Candidatus Zambryskibacteria bacterium]
MLVMREPIEVEAFPTAVLVLVLTKVLPAVIAAARDDDAVPTAVFVFELTAEVMPLVCALVFELICEVSDVDALCTSESVASDPA